MVPLTTSPVTNLLPVESLEGLRIATLIAIVLIAGICFVAGLIMRTRIGIRPRRTNPHHGNHLFYETGEGA